MESEVARLRREIEMHYQAGRRIFSEFATKGSHVIATAHTEMMGRRVYRLRKVAGDAVVRKVLESLD